MAVPHLLLRTTETPYSLLRHHCYRVLGALDSYSLSMATTVSLTILPTTATASIPAPTSLNFPPIGSDDGHVDGGSRNVSYFFGFLIALIAFLVLFLGCGIGVRRGLFRRRRQDEEIGNGILPRTAFGQSARHMSPLREPVLWETHFDKGSSQWESMMVSTDHSLFWQV